MASQTPSIRVRPIAYNWKMAPDPSIISGDHFHCTKPFTIFCSKVIPKDKKVYMEVTITLHPTNSFIRHLPIYLGLHREPSMGTLCNDFIFGSAY